VIRTAVDPAAISWLEIAAVALEMVVATAIAVVVGGRLFRIGLLLSGNVPSLRSIWAQIRRP